MPAQSPLVLLGSTTVTGNAAGDAVVGLERYRGVYGVINVTAAPSGGSPTLDVYIQASPDGGTTWQDVAAQRFTAIGKRVFNLSQIATPGTSTLATSDAALASGSQVQGPFGDRLRVKHVFSAGGSTGSFVYSVSAEPVAI